MNNNEYSIPEYMSEINAITSDPKPTEDPGFDQLRIDTFYYQINNLDKMNERDRYNFVKSNIDFIANQVIDGTCKYTQKLADPLFLIPAKEALRTMPITVYRRLFINKLSYSYQFYKGANDNVRNLLLDATRPVNQTYIGALQSIGLKEEHAAILASSRFSSSDEIVNTNRLNYSIYMIGSKIMTEQMVIWIYEKLFDQMRYLFTGTMLEIKDSMVPPDDHDADDFYETFSIVSLALLTIVNNMTSTDIDRLIRIFLDYWNGYNHPRTRFSLRALSGDFGRIRTIVEIMTEKQRILVP